MAAVAPQSSLNLPSVVDSMDTRSVEQQAEQLLHRHPHFHGRTRWVKVFYDAAQRSVRLEGCLPSFYLKQLAQEALRELDGIDRIDNRISILGRAGRYLMNRDRRQRCK